jgi:hypothetical protein
LSVIFVVGAVASAAVRTAFQVPRRTAPLGLRDAGRGFAELLKPQLRGMFAVFMAQSTMRGLLTVFVAALCLRSGGGGEERVAGLFAAMGVGGLVGAAVAARLPGQGGAARRATLAVVLWGLPIALLGLWPADWMAWGAMAVVGEIGLLMARPRTASVVSAGPAQILWLDAETFIAAVTGHRHASAVAMVVAGDRLASDRSRDDPRHTVEP